MPDLTTKQVYTLGDSIYLLSNSGTWEQVQVEAQSFQGNLVTINDAKEQTFLAGLFANQNAWIGLNDAATEGTFKWISGESVSYTNWEPGQPDNAYSADFALLGSNSEWYDTYQTDNRQGIIEIKNPTTPILVIEDLGIIEPYSGTKQALFKVKLFGSSTQQIKVNYATADDTALAGSNYTATNGTLTFNSGEKEKLISVTILNDGETLSGKKFSVNLTTPVNAILGDNQSTATIHEARNAVTFGGSTYLLSKPGTWGQAQVEATTFGGNLVTINNAAESAFLAGVYANQGAWIALNDAGAEAGADPTKFQWFNGTTAYTNWQPGQPDNAYSGDFALLGGNSEWDDTYQTHNRPGIIEIPTPLSVPIPDMTGRQLYTFGDSIYLLSNSGTWGAAQVEAQSFQGNLATINDAKEQTFLAGLFANQNAWIGLNDAGKEGTFSWISGESVSYTNWQPGQPDNAYSADFAFLGSNSEWYDTYQTDNGQGIIEIKNPTTPILVIEDLGILEPASGTKEAVFIVRRFGNSSNAITVGYETANGTAFAGTNYTAVIGGTLTFAAGQTVQTISINVAKDADTVTGEHFFVNLKNPTNGAILGDNQAKATILEATDATSSGNSTYLLSNAGTWGQAQVEARTLGGNLATINSATEQTFLAEKFASQNPWIGLSDAGGEAGNDPTKFQWVNGTSAYTNWQPGQPDNAYSADFALLDSNSKWFDTYQTDNRKGIVEIPNTVNQVGDATDDLLYGSEGNDTLDGGAGNDNLIGKAGNDILIGNAGNDNLIGNSGNDTLTGGEGNDTLEGGSGNDSYRYSVSTTSLGSDSLVDSSGSDTIDFTGTTNTNSINLNLGSTAAQTIVSGKLNLTLASGSAIENATGGAGNDSLTGNSLNNTLNGWLGNDNLNGGAGNDSLIGGDGNDSLTGGEGNDTLDGGIGNDSYRYSVSTISLGSDRLVDSSGTDTIDFTGTTNTNSINLNLGSTAAQTAISGKLTLTLASGSAIENATGGAGNDSLTGNTLNNTLNGGAGNDSYRYSVSTISLGSDRLVDSSGTDTIDFTETTNTNSINLNLGSTAAQTAISGKLTLTLASGSAIENATGGAGNDILTGNSLNNTLNGGAGNDNLSGGAGNDSLIGGLGNDTVTGGAGADRFIFNSRTEGIDSITDFSVVDDTINVSALGFGGGLTANSAITSAQFKIGTGATTTSHRFIYNNSNGALFFDQDGNGSITQVQIATLNTGLAMTNADIFVVA